MRQGVAVCWKFQHRRVSCTSCTKRRNVRKAKSRHESEDRAVRSPVALRMLHSKAFRLRAKRMKEREIAEADSQQQVPIKV